MIWEHPRAAGAELVAEAPEAEIDYSRLKVPPAEHRAVEQQLRLIAFMVR